MGMFATMKAQLQQALVEIDRQEQSAGPQTVAEVEELQGKLRDALNELEQRKSDLREPEVKPTSGDSTFDGRQGEGESPDLRLRASPAFELVVLDRLSSEEQRALEGLGRDPECSGVLRSRRRRTP